MIDKLIREYIIARMDDEQEALEEFVRIGAKEAAAFQRSLLGNNAAIISFIDSLQEEPVSEDLEEAARRECKGLTDPQEIIDCYCQFIRGANWQKQQMMKTAIETEVVDDSFGQQVGEVPTIRYDVQPEDNLEIGDKVKLIIIKEE